MCEFDKKSPDYLTNLSEIKEKINVLSIAQEVDQTKILDPSLFRQTSFKLVNKHLSKNYNPAFSYSLEYHTAQNKNLAKPSIRKDVENLEKWLSDMLSKIQKKSDYCFQSLIEDLQIIYSACLKELIRQIGLHCSERGQLIEKIWNSYLDLLEKAVISNNKEREIMEKAHLNEIKRIYEIFDKEADKYKAEIETLTILDSENSEKLRKALEELYYLRTKHVRLERENFFLRAHSEDLLKDLKNMAKDLYNYQVNDVTFEKEKHVPIKLSDFNKKDKITLSQQIETFITVQGEIDNEERIVCDVGVNTSFSNEDEKVDEEDKIDEKEELNVNLLNNNNEKEEEENLKNEDNVQITETTSQKNTEITPKNENGPKRKSLISKKTVNKGKGTKNDKNNGETKQTGKKQMKESGFSKHVMGKIDESIVIAKPNKANIEEKAPKIDKETQADMEEFMTSPSVVLDERITRFSKIEENNEEDALETLKTFEKMSKMLATENDLKRSQQKIMDLIEVGKENLMENMELKKDLASINDEMTHFLRENKKLRFTYQKAISDLDELKEKNIMVTNNYKILEDKVRLKVNNI